MDLLTPAENVFQCTNSLFQSILTAEVSLSQYKLELAFTIA